MEPVTALGAAGSIVGIVGFGLQVATTLQTYVEATLEADNRIRDIANDISATASALQRLQAVIVRDEKSTQGRVLSTEGLGVVNKIASQCDAVFVRTVELLNKAGKPRDQLSNSERAKDLKLSNLDHLKWPWLEPKIARCRQELERLLLKLLLMLQISNLAGQQTTSLSNISSQQAFEKQLANETQLRQVISRLKNREERLTHSLEAAIFGNSAHRDHKARRHPNTRDIMAAMPQVSPFKRAGSSRKRKGSSTISPTEARKSLDLQQPAQDIPRENIEISTMFEATEDPGDSQKTGIPEGSVEQKNTNGANFNQSTKPNHEDKAAAVADDTFTGPMPQSKNVQLPFSPVTLGVKQRVEVYLVKGDRDENCLFKLPLGQDELNKKMDAVLAKNQNSVWDTLISLTPKEQAMVQYAFEYSNKQQGKNEPILVAVEIKQLADVVDISEPRQILLFFTKEPENTGNEAMSPERPIYTRMARRYISIETLNRYRLPYEFDTNPEYVLIKRWVPEYEQDLLWRHTKEIRERRKGDLLMVGNTHRHPLKHSDYTLEPEFELVKKKHRKHSSRSHLLNFLAESSRKTSKHSNTNIDPSGDRNYSSRPRPSPSLVLAMYSGGSKYAEGISEADENGNQIGDNGKVDALLAKYTTELKEDEQLSKKVAPEGQQMPQERGDENVIFSKNEEDRLGEEFLESTKLDDYFSEDEHSEDSSSVGAGRTKRYRFMEGLRDVWRLGVVRFRYRRRKGSMSSESDSRSAEE